MDSWTNAIPLIKSGFCDELIRQTDMLRKSTTIFPPKVNILSALELTPLSHVKVIIMGQDPYHAPGQAHGLSFSVPQGVPAPPSLKNIFKELIHDLYPDANKTISDFSTDLSKWARQGVLLLNSSLTVEEKKPGSHQKIGWQTLTDQIINELSTQKKHLVFILWGAFARSKKSFIDPSRHLILEAPHPSPLSAYRGFLGCRHFSKANLFLEKNGITPITW